MQRTAAASIIDRFGVDPRDRLASDRYAIITAGEFSIDREL